MKTAFNPACRTSTNRVMREFTTRYGRTARVGLENNNTAQAAKEVKISSARFTSRDGKVEPAILAAQNSSPSAKAQKNCIWY